MEYGDKFKKSVFGGFDRRNVLQCIEELNARNAEELETERAEKEELQRQLEELRAQLETQQKANVELAAQNEARTRDFAECQEKIERAITSSNELKEQLEAQQKELQALKAANSELAVKRSLLEENNRALKARVEELEEEREGRKVSFEIGEMMVEAKKTADSIVSRASEKADAAHTALEAETVGISARLAEIRTQLSAAADDFKAYSGNIIRSLEEMQRTIEESRNRLTQPVQTAVSGERGPQKSPASSAPAPRQQLQKPRTETKDPKSPYGFLFRK